MKKFFFLFIFIAGTCLIYAQPVNMVDMLVKCYADYYGLNKTKKNEPIPPTVIPSPPPSSASPISSIIPVPAAHTCLPEPEEFYQFFKTTFIDFSALREGAKVNTFAFSDSLCSPLKQDLVLTSAYGMRGSKKHFGVDFRVKVGDTVRSIFCGKVRIAKWDDKYGLVVVIRNYNMSETVYAHLDKVFVRVDQEVEVGRPVGLGGNTGQSSGPHLHLELRYKGFPINPVIANTFLTKIPVKNK